MCRFDKNKDGLVREDYFVDGWLQVAGSGIGGGETLRILISIVDNPAGEPSVIRV